MAGVTSATLKRLVKEKQLMDANPCCEFHVEMSEDNVLEWHFTMLGPKDSPYQHGYYHGKIIIPSDYPFKPPDVVLLTPNGRFELDKRICLSISSYHPENWHPTWGIQTVLHALREFMLTPGSNGIGAIEYPRLVREDLARKSVSFVCPGCGRRVADIQQQMVACPPAVQSPSPNTVTAAGPGMSPLALPSSPPTREQLSLTPSTPQQRAASPSLLGTDASWRSPASDQPTPLALPAQESSPKITSPVAPADLLQKDELKDGTPREEPPAAEPQPAVEVAAPLPAIRRRAALLEWRNGEMILNVPLAKVDTAIHVLLVILTLLVMKKVVCAYWSTLSFGAWS